jgi:16S rRNA (guanine(527)-N(7))-methyltransferase RsmG
MKVREKDPNKLWDEFQKNENLSDEQLAQFKKYAELFIEWNKKMSLTAINNLSEMISRHFRDAIALRDAIDLTKINSIIDIGSGAGVPGIPLKIMFPHLRVALMEVSKKKQKFLNLLIQELGFKELEVCDFDWRTFLRTTEGEIDLFVSRAALPDDELMRMYKPSSAYKEKSLVYWASEYWEPDEKSVPFIQKTKNYTLKKKKRRLIFFGPKKEI